MKTPLAVAAICVGPTASGGAQPWWPAALLVNEERGEMLVFSMSVVVRSWSTNFTGCFPMRVSLRRQTS